ncbi:MAG: HD-GYP domain-containing protein [Lachnospiraceae bacterium]
MVKIRLFTFELEAGMVTAEDVFAIHGQLLVPVNTLLDNESIHKIKIYNVPNVSVWEAEPEDANPTNNETEETFTQRIKASQEFQEFKASYIESVTEFHDEINDIVSKNAPINPADLLAKTAELLDPSATSLHVFDMLHNMREFDDSTYAHCLNVSLLCRILGKWLKLPEDDIDTLTLAGLLHDIGKLTTPEQILTKPGKLTTDEYRIMKAHVNEGYNYLKDQDLDPRIKEACLFHHERCDGTGYPFGLTGDKIPEFAKITSIADVYDAMTATRVYRGPLCPFIVIRHIENEGYLKYDPKILMTFLENVVSSYIHTTVLLTDGRIGEVIMINKTALSRPIVRIGNEFVDLSRNGDIDIEKIV